MGNVRKFNDEQSSEIGYAVGIIYSIAERAFKDELAEFIENVGFEKYIERLLYAQNTLDKFDLDDEDIAQLLKGFHDGGGR
ncbi:hypothetical protein Q9251_08215 [Alkalihalobacillus macyae]|uniref:hypothetical protein n=1 Tax=Guptibacillus hwajinpoensis TaxID=208199 RepID=UPI00273BCFFC|nr:hypothetical protein [Alkalihalobacillus macyae]MDP4550867.1 hypothetical protein [Alkalihalobacillus macyae]